MADLLGGSSTARDREKARRQALSFGDDAEDSEEETMNALKKSMLAEIIFRDPSTRPMARRKGVPPPPKGTPGAAGGPSPSFSPESTAEFPSLGFPGRRGGPTRPGRAMSKSDMGRSTSGLDLFEIEQALLSWPPMCFQMLHKKVIKQSLGVLGGFVFVLYAIIVTALMLCILNTNKNFVGGRSSYALYHKDVRGQNLDRDFLNARLARGLLLAASHARFTVMAHTARLHMIMWSYAC